MARERCPKEATMPTTPTPQAPLSPHWAFVVQLREGTALTPEARHDRVEHIVSGQRSRRGNRASSERQGLWLYTSPTNS
jgi:hypothetical protein